ncbi:MAG: terminase large subunit, partial [Gemmatimonadota bacterium]
GLSDRRETAYRLAAGVGVTGLVADGESRAEVYAAATKKDQAMILFRDAVAMVDQSPMLSARLEKSGRNPVWNLAYHATGSFFRPIASDDSQSGPRPHIALLDELHEHKNALMVEMMRAGTKSRKQALIFEITNSGVDRTSVCYDHHEYGAKVSAGDMQDDSFFAFVCGVDEGEDPLKDEPDPEHGVPLSWLKANPSLQHGGLPGVKYLEEQVREAKGMPAKESIVRRLNFCQWVDAASPWISGDLWRVCEVEGLTLPADRPVYAALDLSGTLDLTAMAVVSPDGEDGFDAEVMFWSPGETLREREAEDRVPYWVWKERGHLVAPPGPSVDYAVPAQTVAELYAAGNLVCLAFDPYMMKYFARELDRIGVPYRYWEGADKPASGRDGVLLVRHGQGYGGGNAAASLWMPHSVNVLEEAVLHGRLRVRKNPVLTWNSASAVLETDAQGNRKWEKRKSTGRIDGIVALSMAVGAADVLANDTKQPRGWLL